MDDRPPAEFPQEQETGSPGYVPAPPVSGEARGLTSRRNVVFVLLLLASVALFWSPLRTLVDYTTRHGHAYDQYTFTLLIPFVSIGLGYLERKRLFAKVEYAFLGGGTLLLVGIGTGWLSHWVKPTLGTGDSLSIAILGLVLFWIGAFTLAYGRQAIRAGAFALLFLLLTVPLPTPLLNVPVEFVRQGSADIASVIFHLFGAPFFRNGTMFMLPGLSIEIAKECSGIHSILALFTLSLLVGHLWRPGGWNRLILALVVFPIVCLTNGLRISAIALLSAYVDPHIIYSSLHRDGGILFFLLGLGLLMLCLRLLNKISLSVRARAGVEK